jgi:hypothetical protein
MSPSAHPSAFTKQIEKCLMDFHEIWCWKTADMLKFSFKLISFNDIGFEVLTTVAMRSAIFWPVTRCTSERPRRFEETYRLSLQVRKVNEARNQHKQTASSASLFDVEQRGELCSEKSFFLRCIRRYNPECRIVKVQQPF